MIVAASDDEEIEGDRALMHPFLIDQLGAEHIRDLSQTAGRSRLAALARGCCGTALNRLKAAARDARLALRRRPAAVECCLA